MPVLRAFASFRPPRFDVRASGFGETVYMMLVEICNGTTAGGSYRIAPAALPEDGRLDVCLVRRVSLARFLFAIPVVMRGAHGNMREVALFQTRRTVRRLDGWTVRRLDGWTVSVFLLTVYPSNRLSAQIPDTSRAPIVTTGAIVVAPDTTHRVRPIMAFLRSLAVPGWGQAVTGRPVAGAAFATWEGVSAMMTLKAQSEFHYLREAGSANVGAKRQEVQDWLVLWIFNHLFSGAEAFVSAHLEDFPRDLKVRAFPGGVGIVIPVPHP